jgi:hypothetical protein
MFFCFLGAITSLTRLGRVHDRQIARVEAVTHGGSPTPTPSSAPA